jgi:hypothetical protein
MDESNGDPADEAMARRSRALFQDSVDGMDYATRSRLTQARHAALEAAAGGGARLRFLRPALWKPVLGVAGAALLGVALWTSPLSGNLSAHHGAPSVSPNNLEDLDIVAASDPGSGDAMEMLQDDLDFYDFADKAASAGPAA